MLADRHRDRAARRRRDDDLDARAVGQARREQGMLAADPLVAERRNLPREPREQRAVEGGHLVALDRPAERLGPQFAGAVDIDIGDLGAVERERQRFEIASRSEESTSALQSLLIISY